MTQTLYVSDLDGTLLDARAQLSSVTRSTLQRLLGEGLQFTIATSRSFASVQHIFQGVELLLPIIEVNGAYLSDAKTGRHEVVSAIAPEILPVLLQLGEQQGCSPLISAYNGQADRLYYTALINDGMRWYADESNDQLDPRWRSCPDLTQVFPEQVVRFTFIHRRDRITDLADQIRQISSCTNTGLGRPSSTPLNTHLFENPYHPGWFWLTVQSAHSTKAAAIAQLRQNHNLTDSELVVFGDENNDREMFELADRAIAVANATDSIKQIATAIIGHHAEDSVAQYLAQDWERQRKPSQPR